MILITILVFVFLQLSNLWDLSDYSIVMNKLVSINKNVSDQNMSQVISSPYNEFLIDHTLKAYLKVNSNIQNDFNSLQSPNPQLYFVFNFLI